MPDITARIRRRLFSGLICKIWRKIMIYELAKPEDLQSVYNKNNIPEVLSNGSSRFFLRASQ